MIYEYIFWILAGVVIYNYFGYTLLLFFLYILKLLIKGHKHYKDDFQPEVTLVVPAYNEIDYIDAKISNTRNLDYPREKLNVLWITDGSVDGSVEKLKKVTGITLMHENERKGKIGAVNRAMKNVKTPFVVFCDANSILNKECIKEILRPFQNKKVGCVAGQKKILKTKFDKAVGTGEGIYWNYESLIKKFESEVNSSVGAAGELFAIRSELFEQIPEDSVIEDFVLSLMIAKKSYKTSFTAKAYSEETASLNIHEELKRKIRIAYGSLQTLFRYPGLLNPFKYGFFSFQYFSHKVLRWTLAPFFIPLMVILNSIISYQDQHSIYFDYLLIAQLIIYFLALLGFFLKDKKVAFGIFFIPFYILLMNFAIVKGYFRYFTSNQSVAWEKSKRG